MSHSASLNRRRLNGHLWRALALCAVTSVTISGCNSNGDPQGPPPAPTATQTALPMVAADTLTLTVWQSQQIQLERAIKQATALQRSVSALLANPNTITLQNTQHLWQQLALSLEPLAIMGALATTQYRHQDQQLHLDSDLDPQNTANWSTISLHHEYIATWPAELGFLDNNGTHGNTGLIFNLDITLNEETLKTRHRQTDRQEGILGLYPLGLMLQGAQTPRQASQLRAVTALTPKHTALGLHSIDEHPHNRRRQLIAQQAQVLRHHLMQLKSQLFKRDSRSALNAFSQQTVAQQQTALVQAAQQLTAQQLQELTQYDDLPLWQQHWQYQRLHAQLTGLELWLGILGHNQQASLCQGLLRLLASHIAVLSTTTTTTTPRSSTSSITATHHTPETQAKSDDHTLAPIDNTTLRQQLAGLTVALKQAIRISSSNTTK